ncbi:vesicle-associated protein 1-2-like isoform X1 [Prunus dulcis]|uniref:vesicle-associated protein 1-2-like isoform X1 n=1 Tax=Prunus dulcis TaxID=3755 RepID=UPI001482E803|nr:vesicle-associated protein 1-2-like isoform X1 [Prunus dulcis]XP_034221539.1 vesicle-associated protein 1-2-like isoform X1 [Prunus dulcis]
MSTQILEIQPKELKFLFELKKQSSCSVGLTNMTNRHVAFKVKTTSPKKYCVRPNVGVILPKSTSEFSVTMQAPRAAPPDMECRDKFLIQSTIVSSGTTDEDITASMFAKDDGKYIEEKKLRVTLISPPNSPMLSPIKVDLKQGLGHEALNDQVFGGVAILPQQNMQVTRDAKFTSVNSKESKPITDAELKPAKDVELKPAKVVELKPAKDVELRPEKDVELRPEKDVELRPAKDVELKPTQDVELKPSKAVELKPSKAVELKLARDVELNAEKIVEDLKLVKDIQEIKSKQNELELKLSQAEVTILKLTEERSSSIQERKKLQEQLAQLNQRGVSVKRVQVGFPLLYVCMVALISVALGYCLHP